MNNSFLALLLLFGIAAQIGAAEPSVKVTVEAEEDVYRYENPDNGSGPFWCFGSTCIIRHGETVLVSGVEKIADAKPLNNTRWMLHARTAQGWKLQQKDTIGRTREPSPLGVFHDGTLLLSVNPTLAKPDAYSGPAQPHVLRFDARQPKKPFQTMLPTWVGQPAFTEHSYRSFAVDGPRREMVLLQNIGYTDGTIIAHSEICRLPYSGVSIGWGWGEEDAGGGAANYTQPFRYKTPTATPNNRCEFNHIHHVMQALQDGWAIYTLSIQPGTIIRGNDLHDNKGGPGGIYLDEGSGNNNVTGNLIYRIPRPLNLNNSAQDRRATCDVHDNALGLLRRRKTGIADYPELDCRGRRQINAPLSYLNSRA